MHNYRWPEAQISRKEYCCNRLAKMRKKLGYRRIEQVWNSANVVALIAVAILEHWQRKFRARYLENCDLEFSNLEDTCPRLLVALILNYKRSTHARKKKSRHLRRKTTKKQKKNRIRERDWGLHQRRKCIDPLKLSHSSFSYFLFIHGDVFNG